MKIVHDIPDVSVVMGVYEGAGQLTSTLESVLIQSGPRFEFVIVNDGSGNEVTEALRESARRDSRLRLFEQANQGLTRALVRGCAEARAPLIVRQDVGDVSLPGRLEALCELFGVEPNAALASSWVLQRGPRGEPLTTLRRGPSAESNRLGLLHERQGPPHHGATSFRREFYETVGGYRTKFRFAQDSDLWLRLAEIGTFPCAQQVLYESTFELTGISATRQSEQAAYGEYAHACRRARLRGEGDPPEPELTTRPLSRADSRGARAAALYYVGACLLAARDARCRPYLREAATLRPLSLRSWAKWVLSQRPLPVRHLDGDPEAQP